MDFYDLECVRKRDHDLYQPDFLVKHSKDLMIRGQVFYAIYNKYNVKIIIIYLVKNMYIIK